MRLRPLDRLVEAVGEDQALASRSVVGAEFLAQDGVAHLVLEVRHAELVDRLHLRCVHVGEVVREARDHLLGDLLAQPAHRLGLRPEMRHLHLAEGRVLARGDPLRRALKEPEFTHPVDEFGCDLHGARPGADDADASPGERHRVIPPRAVERRSGERGEARQVGDRGMVQHAGRRDEHVGLIAHAPGRLESPAPGCAGPPRADGRRPRSRPGSRPRERSGGSTRD